MSWHDPTFSPSAGWREELEQLKRSGLRRRLRNLRGAAESVATLDGREVLVFCSNNYLGLAADPRLRRASQEATALYGCGATGSRLITGNSDLYAALERELAAFKGAEAALVYASGYHANIGTIPTLVEAGDAIFSDVLNHASIIDASRLSRAEINVYRHCDPNELERLLRSRASARRKLIVTEAVFSMDGDLAPLGDIAWLAKKYSALLMVDEAHATGVFGPGGAGRIEELGLQDKIHIQMGTFSKALGSLGGYVAGSRELIEYLLNKSRSLIFTTGLPPGVLAASLEAIRIVRGEPERRAALWANVSALRQGIAALGFELAATESQIIPVILHDDRRAVAASRYLLRKGIFVQGIRPPTVPPGTARLRIAPTASHRQQEVEKALAAFGSLAGLLHSPRRRGWRVAAGAGNRT